MTPDRSQQGPLRRWWNDIGPFTRLIVRWTAIVLSVALLASGSWWAWDATHQEPDLTCDEDEGIARPSEDSEECIGVTDGSFVFASHFDEIFGLIKRENDEVIDQWERENDPVPYVTIGFVLPFTSPDPIERGHMLREVQGAYLAQRHANAGQERPRVRLVLGNTGEHSRHYGPVVDRLGEMARSPEDRLRVVTGFDVSTKNTANAIRQLTENQNIPMVVGPLTADDVENDGDDFPGLAKVVPNNSDQARALASHFSGVIEPEETLLVEDLRENDNYVASLRDVFRERTREAPFQPLTFRSPQNVNHVGNQGTVFNDMVRSICTMDGVNTIYFAGRNVSLRVFVNELAERPCENRYRVITISGASTLVTDEELDWEGMERTDIEVLYTTNAHPEAWTTPAAPEHGGSARGLENLREAAEDAGVDVALGDSRAITMYDAVTTAVAGVQRAAEGGIPSLDEVEGSWAQMNGAPGNFVDGASGWICLNSNGTPYNKSVAILRLVRDEESGSGGNIEFVALAWPEGAPPPDENCHIPNAAKQSG